VRTTLNIEEDVLQEVKRYANARALSLGRAVSDLVRRGLSTPVQTRVVNGVHVVVLPPDSSPVDSVLVRELIEDEIE